MAYLGGKARGADYIIKTLNNPLFNDMDYIEPFCGYCHILRRVKNKKSYTASDNNELLMILLKHIQKHKGKHEDITFEDYQHHRSNPLSGNKLRSAYAAFTYSYNGKYFDGYIGDVEGRDYPKERKKYYDKLHNNDTFQKTELKHGDYTMYMDVKDNLIYCDPPYQDTTEYHSSFDSSEFWENMRELSKDNIVIISEYNAPDDFVCITSNMRNTTMRGKGATKKNEDKLFIHKSLMTHPLVKKMRKRNIREKYKKTRKVTKTRK